MPAQLVALGGKDPQIDALGSFGQGERQQVGVDQAKRKAVEEKLQLVGAASMHALGGNINGQADPAKFEQGLDMLQSMGMNVEQFRGKPQMAAVAARASIDALHQVQLAQNGEQLDQAAQEFSHKVMNDDREFEQGNRRLDIQQQAVDLDSQRQSRGDVPSGYRATPTGMEPIPGGPADPENPLNRNKTAMNGAVEIAPDGTISVGGKLTGEQSKVAGYANRMTLADSELTTAPEGDESIMDSAHPGADSLNPLSADFWTAMNRKYGPNITQTPEYQRYVNGAREWVRAKLRKESGAAIPPKEWEEEFATYFPQPGDSKETIEQKSRFRANAADSMIAESRGAYEALFGIRERRANGKPVVEGGSVQKQPSGGAGPQDGQTRYKKDAQGNVTDKQVFRNGQWAPY